MSITLMYEYHSNIYSGSTNALDHFDRFHQKLNFWNEKSTRVSKSDWSKMICQFCFSGYFVWSWCGKEHDLFLVVHCFLHMASNSQSKHRLINFYNSKTRTLVLNYYSLFHNTQFKSFLNLRKQALSISFVEWGHSEFENTNVAHFISSNRVNIKEILIELNVCFY